MSIKRMVAVVSCAVWLTACGDLPAGAADVSTSRPCSSARGQERPVTIVKLVTQNTIEEKVLSLHEHKRRLADSVLSSADPMLDREVLEALLSE